MKRKAKLLAWVTHGIPRNRELEGEESWDQGYSPSFYILDELPGPLT